MNFVSTPFLIFFIAVLTSFWVLRRYAPTRGCVLLVANICFYSFAGLAYIPLLLFIAAIAWGTGIFLSSCTVTAKRKTALFFAIAIILLLLAFFKYYEFFFLSLDSLFVLMGGNIQLPLSFAEIAFPIGISFYSFQAIAYCVEQYKNSSYTPKPYTHVLLYLSFFPTVLAGPIMRPAQFFPQLDAFTGKGPAPAHNAAEDITKACAFIISGLFKKVVLASYLSEVVVRDVFQAPEGFSSWGVLVAVYGYAVQIYCDFSGYTDLALGVALLFGFSLPANFAAPYMATNLQDFWRKWHISLSSWLRDYLYIPLGGSKQGNRYRNLLITMLLGGLWHGAHVRFIIWGALHGTGLVIVHAIHQLLHRNSNEQPALPTIWNKYVWPFLCWLFTFHFVCFAWIFFRAEDMERAIEIIKRVALWGQSGDGFAIMALPAIALGIVIQAIGPKLYEWFTHTLARVALPLKAAIVAIIINIIFRMGPDGVLPFIYFQF